MHVMRCPDCGTQNPVDREHCRACGHYLWPQPGGMESPSRPGSGPHASPAPAGRSALRFLLGLFGVR